MLLQAFAQDFFLVEEDVWQQALRLQVFGMQALEAVQVYVEEGPREEKGAPKRPCLKTLLACVRIPGGEGVMQT